MLGVVRAKNKGARLAGSALIRYKSINYFTSSKIKRFDYQYITNIWCKYDCFV